MVSTFVIILRELGGGHGEMNAPCSSEELQIGPGEDLKNHVLVFEIQSLTQFVDGGEKYQEVFWKQGERNLNVTNSSVLWVLSRVASAGAPACAAMLSNASIYCFWMKFIQSLKLAAGRARKL